MAQHATTDGDRAHGSHGLHDTHHDVSADKSAAFMGLFAGMLLLGGLIFGMVKWTNHHLGAGEKHSARAEATK